MEDIDKEIDKELDKELDKEIDIVTGKDIGQNIGQNIGKKKKGKIKKYLLVVWPMIVVVLVSILYIVCAGVMGAIIILSALLPQKGLIGNIFAVTLAHYINLDSMALILMLLLQCVWVVVFLFWYKKIVKTKSKNRKSFLRWKNLGLIILLAVGNNILISGAMDLLIPYLGKIGEDYIGMMDDFFAGNTLLVLISSLILAPISEELICRGVILKNAREAFPFAVANVIQALLFGLMHGNLIQGTYAFVLGLSLGYVTYKFDTILPAMLIHLLLNILGSYLLFTVPTFVQIIEVILGIGMIVFAINRIRITKSYEIRVMN